MSYYIIRLRTKLSAKNTAFQKAVFLSFVNRSVLVENRAYYETRARKKCDYGV